MRPTLLKLALRLHAQGVQADEALPLLRDALDALLAFEVLAATVPGPWRILALLGEYATDALLIHMDGYLRSVWLEAEDMMRDEETVELVSADLEASTERRDRLRAALAVDSPREHLGQTRALRRAARDGEAPPVAGDAP